MAQSKTKAAEQKAAGGGGKDEKAPVLRIRAKAARFRRAGFTFGREERVIALDQLTDEQVAALKAEPMLAVTEADA